MMRAKELMRQAAPTIPCVDQWPLDQVDASVRGAYVALARRGEIAITLIRASRKNNLCVIEYLSTLPPDWTRQALKKERKSHGQADV